MARLAIPFVAATLCLLACVPLRAQSDEPPEFREAFEAYFRGDYASALPVLRELAEQAHAPSRYLLAVAHLTGSGIARNEIAAAFWLHRAALQDYPLAQYELAVMLDEGLGIEEDRTVARVLLDHAALRGNASAQRRLKIMTAPIGTDQDELQAAEQLHAQQDEGGAFLRRLRVARRGNVAAQHAVGLAYWSGEGAVRNPDKALEWLRKAATAGNIRSQALLGTLLERGEGVEHDLREALEWDRKAALQGDAGAAEAARALTRKLEGK